MYKFKSVLGGTEVGPGDTNTESDRTKAVPGRTIAEPWQDLTVPGSNGRVGPPLQDLPGKAIST